LPKSTGSKKNDAQKEYHDVLSENVNRRLTKAMEELREKETRRIAADKAAQDQKYDVECSRMMARKEESKQLQLQIKESGGDGHDVLNTEEESDEDEFSDDGDPELEAIRLRRIREMKEEQSRRAESISKGHGQYRTISQDEFLSECCGSSEYVAVHFYHDEFQRCKIMDHHLKIIAPECIRCKFLRIDAEKAPFFVTKLRIRTLPTLIVFQNGKAVDRLTGFEGLSDPKDPDKWHTGKLLKWLASTGAVEYREPSGEVLEEMKRLGLGPKGSLYSGSSCYDSDDE